MQVESSGTFCNEIHGSYIKPAVVGAVHPKQDRMGGEFNNCTVRTLANCADMQYDTAHALLAKAGRRSNKGCTIEKYLPVYFQHGAKKFTSVGNTQQAKYLVGAYRKIMGEYPDVVQGMTIKTMLSKPEYQRGVFAVEVRGHIFALRHGKIYDIGYNKLNARVCSIIEF
jgi:hypothetical protein